MSSVMIARLCSEPSLNPAFRLPDTSSSQPGASVKPTRKYSPTSTPIMYTARSPLEDSFNLQHSQPTSRPSLNRRPTLLQQSGLYVHDTLCFPHRPKPKVNLIISGTHPILQKPHEQPGHTFLLACSRPNAHGLHHRGQPPTQEIRVPRWAPRECLRQVDWQSALRDRQTCPSSLRRRITTTTTHSSHQTLTRQHLQDLTQ